MMRLSLYLRNRTWIMQSRDPADALINIAFKTFLKSIGVNVVYKIRGFIMQSRFQTNLDKLVI